MSLIDLFWNVSQDHALDELATAQRHAQNAVGKDAAVIKRLQAENQELQHRVAILIRMLIAKGVFSADEFSTLLEETTAKLARAESQKS